MLKNEKILITGITSATAKVLAGPLAGDNEVWGVARFSKPGQREAVEAMGVKAVPLDLGNPDLSVLPEDFTYVLHLAYFRSPNPDFEEAFRINGDGTGFIFRHCRKAKAALCMSSSVIYSADEDPWHVSREDGLIGWNRPGYSATSAVSKMAEEAIARYCARAYELPMIVTRLNAPYGPTEGFLPTGNMDAVVAGKEVFARWDPEPYTPIHTEDMAEQLEALLNAASVPANCVNWAGDEYVTVQQMAAYASEWSGKEAKVTARPVPGSHRGSCSDSSKRRSITGPCRYTFKEGYRKVYEARHGAPVS
jgi:nucleoside-diphosphate-sugar epimerase